MLETKGTTRHTTVLLAEVRSAAPAATDPAVPSTLKVLRHAAELSGGRVLHDRNSAVLALFPTADAAAAASARMHAYTETLPPTPSRPGLGIAFHAGPVSQRNEDIFGDTVNLALQLASEAKIGQILTSQDTASSLNPAIQSSVRPARSIRIKGKGDELIMGELVWRNATQDIAAAQARSAGAQSVLQVSWRGKTVWRRREGDQILLGRDADCGLQVDGATVSRRHCTIFRYGTAFLLRDHSSNGTYVTLRGQPEVRVKEAELTLSSSGRIALGQPAEQAAHFVGFTCS